MGAIIVLCFFFLSTSAVFGLVVSTAIEIAAPTSYQNGSTLLASQTRIPYQSFLLASSDSGLESDVVVRIMDANTVRLEKLGLVNLAGVQTPVPGSSQFSFSECLSYSPSYKLKKLLPPKTAVRIRLIQGSNGRKQAVIFKTSSEEMTSSVNEELVRTGFARVRSKNPATDLLDSDRLKYLEQEAKSAGKGIFQQCDALTTIAKVAPMAEFEPLDYTTETIYGDDGGKTVLRKREETSSTPPINPGDKVGCSDFPTYEDALRYYEKYLPYYGDVARLDRDRDGVPCPGLPHTSNQDRYRMKIPIKTEIR